MTIPALANSTNMLNWYRHYVNFTVPEVNSANGKYLSTGGEQPVGNAYLTSTYAQNTYVNTTFAQNNYAVSTFAQNTYVNATFSPNTYVNTQLDTKAANATMLTLLDTKAANATVIATYSTNTYVNATFAQNTYVNTELDTKAANATMLTLLDTKAANATVIATYSTNTYVNSTFVQLAAADQSISGGARVVEEDLGVQSSGTLTPDPGDRPMQRVDANGAFTLAPGANHGNYILTIVNGSSAGAITTSGWSFVAGDSFTTTNNDAFRCHCTVAADGSLIIITAMQ